MKLISFLLIQLLALSVFAQSEWYLVAGINVTSSQADFGSFNDTGFKDVDEKIGLQLGVGRPFHLSDKITWDSQLFFITKGHRGPASLVSDRNYNLNYLDLYSQARLQLMKRLSVAVGPQVGVLLWHRSGFEDHSRFDVGAAGDLQFKLTSLFDLSIRYTHGLINTLPKDAVVITDEIGNVTGDQLKYRNRSIQLSLHYRI